MSKTYITKLEGDYPRIITNVLNSGDCVISILHYAHGGNMSKVVSVPIQTEVLKKLVDQLSEDTSWVETKNTAKANISDSTYKTWKEVTKKKQENISGPRISIELDYTMRGPIDRSHSFKIWEVDRGYAISGEEEDLATSISKAIRGWLRYNFNQSDESYQEVFSKSHYLKIHLE